jgi:tetratricopeptide (TPR) repeat protein
MSKRLSRGELRLKKQQQQTRFIGREQELARFRDNLQRPFDDPAFTVIFSIAGQGGVGKTTLLRQWQQMLKEKQYLMVWLDESNVRGGAVETLAEMVEQLSKQGGEFKQFRKQYQTFRTKREEVELGPDAPRGVYGYAAETLTRTALAVGKANPIGAAFAGLMDEEKLVSHAGSWADHVRRKLGREEAKLVLDPLAELTPLFLKELDALVQKRPLAILIDTYEVTGSQLDEWLAQLLNGQYGDVPMELLLLLAGRDPLGTNWQPLADLCHAVSLAPFTPEETGRYLAGQGVTNPAVQELIVALSNHLPLLVSLLAHNAPQTVDEVGEVNTTAVERFLKWEPDPLRRRVALEAAVAQFFNRDVLAVVAGMPRADVEPLFNWLVSQPFVLERSEGWQYHDVVRPQMLRQLRRVSPQRWGDLHAALGDYYADQEHYLGLKLAEGVKNPRWLACVLPQMYHRLCQHPERMVEPVLGYWLELWGEDQKTANRLAAMLEMAGGDSDTPSLRDWHGRLSRAYEAWQTKDWPMLQAKFRLFTQITRLTEKQQAIAWARIGETESEMGEYKAAVVDYDRALELDPNMARTWGMRGLAKWLISKLEAAVVDYDRALELDPTMAWVWSNRGITNRLMGQYEAAVADCDRALEIDSNSVWARVERGVAKRLMGQYEAAMVDFDSALELDPNYASAWAERGLAKVQMGQYQTAVADFDCALELGDPNMARTWTQRAQAKMQMGQYQMAVADFDRALELIPSMADAWASRGQAKMQMGQYQTAVADFDRTLELDPNMALAWVLRGQVKVQMGQYQTAVADFDRTLELAPNVTLAWVLRGQAKVQMGQYQTAVADCDRAMELDPNMALAWVVRGLAKMQMGQYQTAVADCDRAMELDPNMTLAWVLRRETKQKMGQYEATVADFDCALELDPSNAGAWVVRGLAKVQMGRYEAAMADADRVLELNPNMAEAWVVRGQAKVQMGQSEAAVADFDCALELVPNNAGAWILRGLAKVQMGQYKAAVADFDRALELVPNMADAWASRGQAKVEMGQYQAAVTDFDRALELVPNMADAWASRGQAKVEMGQYQAAVTDFDRALELVPNMADAWGRRGQAKVQMRQHEAAVADFDRALELDSTMVWVWRERGQTKRQMGEYEAAVADFDRALELDPNDTWTLSARGECNLHLQQFPIALADFTGAAELKPENDWYCYGQALASKLLGDEPASAAQLQLAIGRAQAHLDKEDNPRVAFNLALYQLMAGNASASQATYHATLAQSPSRSILQDAIRDLEDYRTWFPAQAEAVAPLLALLHSVGGVETG